MGGYGWAPTASISEAMQSYQRPSLGKKLNLFSQCSTLVASGFVVAYMLSVLSCIWYSHFVAYEASR